MHQIIQYIDFPGRYQRRTLVAIAQSSGVSDWIATFLKENARRVGDNIYHLWDSSVRYRIDSQDELESNIALDFTTRTHRGLRESMGIVLAAFPDTFQEYASMPDPLLQIRVGILAGQPWKISLKK